MRKSVAHTNVYPWWHRWSCSSDDYRICWSHDWLRLRRTVVKSRQAKNEMYAPPVSCERKEDKLISASDSFCDLAAYLSCDLVTCIFCNKIAMLLELKLFASTSDLNVLHWNALKEVSSLSINPLLQRFRVVAVLKKMNSHTSQRGLCTLKQFGVYSRQGSLKTATFHIFSKWGSQYVTD